MIDIGRKSLDELKACEKFSAIRTCMRIEGGVGCHECISQSLQR